MKALDLADVRQYVTSNISTFHNKRLASLNGLDLAKILRRKNPYLFKVKYLLTAEQIERTLRTSNSKLNIVAVNGCCYGRDAKPDKGDYYKYCGQAFWEFISGDPDLYTKLIVPLGHRAKQHTANFDKAYAQAINRMTADFNQNFCRPNGSINWQKLVEFNSKDHE